MRVIAIVLLMLSCCVSMAAPMNVVQTARMSSQPELSAEMLRRLVDTQVRQGIVFPVGSTGDAKVLFTFLHPHQVSGIRFHQTTPIYCTTRFKVTADTDGDGKLETTLFEGKAGDVPGWSSAEWKPVRVHALELVSVEGVSKGKRAHPCMNEVEVLGEPMPTDNEDARSLGHPVTQIAGVRPIDRWVDLSGKTRPVVVLSPSGKPFENAAKAIADAIAAKGGKRPAMTTDPTQAVPEQTNVIAIGNVNNNELIARLYWNYYAYEDSLLPGPKGYSLRTVYDPYPWHGKGDVVVIGVSEADSAAGAARVLAERLKSGKTPVGVDYTLVVSSAKPLSDATKARLVRMTSPSFKVFFGSAKSYLKTGHEAYARHAIATLERIVKLYREKPDHDCDWPEETSSAYIMATWDVFEECPLMTDKQREDFTWAFLKLLRVLPHHVSGYSRIGKDDLVTWNHTTFPLMGLYFGSRYFGDYYSLTEAEQHLAKASTCMLAQAKSWKPQEDADSYVLCTMTHVVDYCLAEWRVDLLRNGMMQKYADYVIAMCDNAGLNSGFGDSGLSAAPSLCRRAVPRAFWFTRDPGYLWIMKHIRGEKWPNPFHRDVEPKEPKEHLGVRVFPLDPQIYEYTRLHAPYGGTACPPNVPIEAAFDKVSFRESWDKQAQYLLLDGYSRGKHLHYDGNAIIEFVDRGQRWLLDHDYLTRNTTEHNMLSIVRNGRSDLLMPSCAALRCAADVGGRVGLVSTYVKDYLGIDWRRDIFWRRGDFFVVMDRATVKETGDYDLDVVWKVEDRGDERLAVQADETLFEVLRRPVFGRTQHVTTIDDADASGGKAVLFNEKSSVLSFVVDLPAGEYGFCLRAYGRGSGSDSFFASAGGSEPVACHVPQMHYGPSNTKFDHSGKIPIIKLVGEGPHLVSLSMRENPPLRLDTITFVKPDGQPALALEAESVQKPKPEDLKGVKADRFYIKWPDAVSTRMTTAVLPGMRVPVRKLWQRRSGRMAAGESAEVANIFYTDDTLAPANWRIRRIAPGAVRVDGDEPALLAVRGAEVPGLMSDAEMIYVSPSTVAWAGGNGIEVAGGSLKSAGEVCDVEFDLRTGKGLGNVKVEPNGLTANTIRQWLAGLKSAQKENARREKVCPRAKRLWTAELPTGGPVRRIRLVDLDGDGKNEILAAAGRTAMALSGKGDRLWSFDMTGACNDVAAGELKPEKGPEVVATCNDTYARMFDARGKLLSKHQIRGPVWSSHFGDRPWACLTALVSDLNKDGRNEIILSTKSFEVRMFDADWQQLVCARKTALHGSLDFYTHDIDGDGKQELFLTNRYGAVCVLRHDGKRVGTYYTSIGDVQAVVADLDGDGQLEVVNGSSTGDLACWRLPKPGVWKRGDLIWRFDNFGYGVNRLRAADLDGDGKQEVAVASQTGYLYVLDGDGKVKWQDRTGSDIVEVVALEHGPWRLAYFDRDGVMTVATGDGKTRKRVALDMQPRRAVVMDGAIVIGGERQLGAIALPES